MIERATVWLGLVCLAVTFAGEARAQDDATEIVAAAVRQNGYVCTDPASVTPDPQASGPDEEAWIIHCANGAYRVKFKGDEGAEVEPL